MEVESTTGEQCRGVNVGRRKELTGLENTTVAIRSDSDSRARLEGHSCSIS
jgi:hypothetical protein